MMKTKTLLLLFITLFLLGEAGCEKKASILEKDTVEAVIKNTSNIDDCGGFMVVIGSPEKTGVTWYKPENLPPAFQIDNLKVRINYSLTEKTHSCGFGGNKTIIIIHHIEKV